MFNPDGLSSWSDYYFMKDHLGSTRLVISIVGTADPRVVQTTEYYPFGLAMNSLGNLSSNKYLYNGKEYQDAAVGDLGALGLYDYGARFYDPEIGRWTGIDPLASKYASLSPYAYCGNNPVRYIDPNGMDFTESARRAIEQLQEEAKKRMAENKKQIKNLKSEMAAGGLSDRQMTRYQKKIDGLTADNAGYETMMQEINQLNESSQVYNVEISNSLNTGDNAIGGEDRGGARFNEKTGQFDIIIPGEMRFDMLAHELKHAYQFETGAFSTDRRNKNVFYDKYDEIEAHDRGALFGGQRYRNTYELPAVYNHLPEGPIDATNHPNIQYNLNNPVQLQTISNNTGSIFRINNITYRPKTK